MCAQTVHSLLRGRERLLWSHEATATTLCPPPCPPPPSSPTPRLAARPTSSRHATGFAPHPHPTPPSCSWPIDTALLLSSDQSWRGAVLPEENPIQNAALPLRVPCVSLYLLHNVYKNTYFTSKVGTFLEVGPFWLVPTALKDFLRVKTWV